MNLANPFFRLSKREQRIHGAVWLCVLIVINIPEWSFALGPFHSDDYSLLIPSIYGIVFKTYLFYGCAFTIADPKIASAEKKFAKTLRIFFLITLIEVGVDIFYYAFQFWIMSVEGLTEIILGETLINFSFFYLPSLMFGFIRFWYNEPIPEPPPELTLEDRFRRISFPTHACTHIKSEGDHSIVFASKKYELVKTLDTLQDELPKEFIRCHDHYIINASLIIKEIGDELVVGGFILPVGSEYRENLKLD